MFIRLFLCGVAVMLLLAGCRTETSVSGESCYGISDSEKDQLVELARKSLNKKNSVVTPEEFVRYIKNTYPEIKMRYAGDRFGVARIVWSLPNRQVTMVFSGDLMTEKMIWNAESKNLYDDDDIVYQNVPGKQNTPPAQSGFQLPSKR